MELQEFIDHFTAQFDEPLVNITTADTVFRDISEWGSVVALMVIAMADEEYNVKLTGEDIRNCVTVGDIFEKVKSKKG